MREAVSYVRVSSEEQRAEGFSLEAQAALLEAYASREGLTIVHRFSDVETAKKAGRTAFGEMLQFLRKHPSCRVVLVEKVDRLYRNLHDWVSLDEVEGLVIHLVKEGSTISEASKSSEKFVHGIRVLMARNYVQVLGEEASKGMAQKAAEGIWPSAAPLGYLNTDGPAGKRIIVPDPEAGPIIRRLFEVYATGQSSVSDLAKVASGLGLRYRRSGGKVPRSVLHQTLKNPLMYGEFMWRGKKYQGKHEPLVSRDLFERVQEVLDGRGKKSARTMSHSWTYKGLVKCGECGALMTGDRKKGHVYYRCATAGRGECSAKKYVKEEALDAGFVRALGELHFTPAVLEAMRTALKSSFEDKKAFHNAAIDRLQAEYTRLQNRIDAAYEDKLDGRIDPAFFDRKAEGWKREQGDVLVQIARHQKADESYMDLGIELLELAAEADELYAEQRSGEEKRKLLGFVCSNSIWANGELKVEWRIPFDLIALAGREAKEEEASKVLFEASSSGMAPPSGCCSNAIEKLGALFLAPPAEVVVLFHAVHELRRVA